ncbi:hypothetical protein [Ottowia testudinis]|uniref:Uncharacterized protein n=1 Tax=Ottowia testudinis TaxID=2816950 RepID=A0A975CJI1_9BURK|nr:hypothetical protein [Ottowia testudinis]QTD44578.1 hypothetical protein J1M35_15990 [Ottowia testudinis]
MPNPTPILTAIDAQHVSVLDLSKVPTDTLLPIVQRAIAVAYQWGNGDIDPESADTQELLDGLSTAVNGLDSLYKPVVPAAAYTVGGSMLGHGTYPVLRNGKVEHVRRDKLTETELVAVERWLQHHADSTAQHAAEITRRRQELLEDAEANRGYVPAPAPDWRL